MQGCITERSSIADRLDPDMCIECTQDQMIPMPMPMPMPMPTPTPTPNPPCSPNPECESGQICNECALGEICDPCGTSSCPECQDCIPACIQVCESESNALCEEDPPKCEEGLILIVQNECWECVEPPSCEPPSLMSPPRTCETSLDCLPGEVCDECAASSCPGCDDCIPLCSRWCESEVVPVCNALRPDCAEGFVAIVYNDCWECVTQNSCEPASK